MSFVMIDPEAPAEALEAPSNALDVSSVQPTWEALEFYGPADRRIHHPELDASAAASDQCPLTGTALDESAIIDELHDMFDLIVEAPAAQAFESFVPEPVELDSDERETALYRWRFATSRTKYKRFIKARCLVLHFKHLK